MEEIENAHQSQQQEDVIVHVKKTLLRKMELAHQYHQVSSRILFINKQLKEIYIYNVINLIIIKVIIKFKYCDCDGDG